MPCYFSLIKINILALVCIFIIHYVAVQSYPDNHDFTLVEFAKARYPLLSG